MLLVSKVMAVHFLFLLYFTSWKTWNLPYQCLQVLREVEQKCHSPSLGTCLSSKETPNGVFARKDMSCEEHVFNCRLSRARRCVERAFGILTTKWRLLNKAIETHVNKPERAVRWTCLLHNTIIDTEGTTRDPSVLQENSQIHVSRQTKTNVSRRLFSRFSKGAIDVRNAFKAHCNGPIAAILSQNQ